MLINNPKNNHAQNIQTENSNINKSQLKNQKEQGNETKCPKQYEETKILLQNRFETLSQLSDSQIDDSDLDMLSKHEKWHEEADRPSAATIPPLQKKKCI